MKNTILFSVVWLISSFLLLTWLLYAVTDFATRTKMPSDARTEAQAAMERSRAFAALRRDATKAFEERVALQTNEFAELERYADILSAERARHTLIERAFVLWAFMAVIPLVFLWWRHVTTRLRRLQAGAKRVPEVAQEV